MGAVTYIGNGPNFMVKAIAEQHHVRTPSFFGYIVWSGAILLPPARSRSLSSEVETTGAIERRIAETAFDALAIVES